MDERSGDVACFEENPRVILSRAARQRDNLQSYARMFSRGHTHTKWRRNIVMPAVPEPVRDAARARGNAVLPRPRPDDSRLSKNDSNSRKERSFRVSV